ncbi:protein LYRIC-like isoform X4 [Sinocyclocheilus anshuiensis]|uniref:Protein LYRIC-like n=1 Tax=Sinocyclocheilus anshuiensis TaxID=1608454 RepID=A0A671PWP6_9TELE|nr:PREDICTED: protein LYRIC-like isoform X4 [Sinocyclocheilus anshuiensis]
MAPGWQEIASQHVEQITGYVRETLSTGLVYLKSELGIDLGLNPDLCAPWLLLLSAWGGLVLILILWVSVCRGLSKRLSGTETGADNTGPAQTVKKADEPRRRNRKKNAEKVEAKLEDGQELPEVKTDKAKKNKKKAKPPAKEKKSSTSVDGKEPDEGTWETKVSNREKRQQRRKDKTPGDESGSPVATAASSAISTMEEVQTTPEEPETTITTTVSTPPVQREVEVDPPEIEASFVRDTVVPQVMPCWQEVLAVNSSGWSDQGLQLPPQMASVQAESWTSMTVPTERQTSEPSVWPQDIEGSWTIVDGPHNSVSFSGLTAVPDLSWSAQPSVPVDDEWSGINSTSADLLCDWNAPSEEWGNYVEQQPVSAAPIEPPVPEVAQESDNEKDKDEAGAPGSGRAKKKKKKKKVEDAVPSAQPQEKAERDPSVATLAQSAAGNISPATARPRVDDTARAVPSASVLMQQRMTGPEPTDKSTPGPTQKKTDDGKESSKQPVKKKKARRET